MPARSEASAVERRLSFSLDDMALFADASGDHSPLHMNDAFARRTAFGERILHGGLLTVGMLGILPSRVLTRIRALRSSFPGPVLPGQVCSVTARSRGDHQDEWEIRLSGRGRLLARVLTSTRLEPPAGLPSDAPRPEDGSIDGAYTAGAELEELARRFGVQSLDRALLVGVGWASSVVGTTIPDFEGLCAAVTLFALPGGAERTEARQAVHIRAYDERTDRMLVVGVLSDQSGTACCTAQIECFPFSPTPPPESAQLSPGNLEPARGRVVVVGSSRGLGATMALKCLLRGYAVHALYSSSSDAARDLERLAGPYAERLTMHQVDAADAQSLSAVAAGIGGPIDGLALCAAPVALPMTLTADTTAELGDYVTRSVALAATPMALFLPQMAPDGWALFCSAAGDHDRHRPQFKVAKAAAEGLAHWLASTRPGLRVLIARLPAMRTDLANTPGTRAAATPPDAVAASLLEYLFNDGLAPGVSVISPECAAVLR